MTIQPEKITNQLIDELMLYVDQGKLPDQFTFAKLKKEAKKLDLGERSMVLGMIACLEGDVETSKKQHELSLTAECDPFFYLNYTCSLLQLGYWRDAKRIIDKAYAIFPHTPNVLKTRMKVAMFFGLHQQISHDYEALIKTDPSSHDTEIDAIIKQVKNIKGPVIPNKTWMDSAALVESIGIKYKKTIDSILLLNDGESLFQWLETSADVDTTVDMNMALCEAFAKNDIDLSKLTVAFRSVPTA